MNQRFTVHCDCNNDQSSLCKFAHHRPASRRNTINIDPCECICHGRLTGFKVDILSTQMMFEHGLPPFEIGNRVVQLADKIEFTAIARGR